MSILTPEGREKKRASELARYHRMTDAQKALRYRKYKDWIARNRAADPNWDVARKADMRARLKVLYRTSAKHRANIRKGLAKQDPQRAQKLHRERMAKDPQYRARKRAASAFRRGFKQNRESTRYWPMIGCSRLELKKHLESLWSLGMGWDNYGFRGWHIDHIKPLSSFDLTDPGQVKACFHFSNTQPLWGRYNMSKSRGTTPLTHVYDPNDVI